ncbi:hypothetical protein KSF_085720 [Reticulibacter mediterranei]|uniref:Glycosyltransferase subfamily 4-like N-terminal domain-containing protein n=1 Tax=Reticulibacter mediterranei TaxID=2778369 RepID=A0A8J3IVB6_9CHLR|nr:glycosyltransferase family 4 protein [Reticulibacter mediterranei]GHO98524.1 hypothetical protein KSF_085720 [Reticulibacter mediterranei]
MHQVTSDKPEIVHVIAYYPPHLGGMENCAAHLADGCVERGYRVSVYTSDRGYSRQTALHSKVQVHYLKAWEWAHTPIIFTLVFHLLALPRRTLIHLHISQAFAPEVVYLVSKLRGIPYVAHMHLDVDPSGPFGFLLGPYKRLFLKRVLHAAAKVICLSEPQQQLIAKKYHLSPEAIAVIPNGVAGEYFVGAKAEENAVPRLLFVGRLSPKKISRSSSRRLH